eukprot:TRINITY_DN1551_c0_g1_i1.p1 TRINITY_DN1551_c0_g1~~TRINITY_DN1551_c0_g1_i1.p1  ORF type:complete len:499 (-),score=96.41 TRINITY_DN1551_c0_g1_i1:83-1579(-)
MRRFIRSASTSSTSSPITNLTNSSSSMEIDQVFQGNVETLKSILGDEISYERVRHALRGADGDVEVALNHLLNDREKERSRSDTPTDSSGLTPLEKVLCELAEEVKCPMCLSYFREPLVLSCFHTFCYTCLDEIVTEENTIQCPLCRVLITLSERRLADLKPNHYLANIVEKLKAGQSTKMCAECQKSLCTVFCKQCKGFLCTECNDKIHTIRVLNTHHRVPFEDMFFGGTSPPKHHCLYDFCFESDCVIPFNVKREVCLDLFYFWTKELWFAPSDLEKKAVLSEFKALYMPYWLFEVEVNSQYSCTLGFSDQLLMAKERRAGVNMHCQPTQGTTTQKFSNLVVCASDLPETPLLADFEPWRLEQIQHFTLKHAEGVDVRPFALESEKAWDSLAKDRLHNMNREAFEKSLKVQSGADAVVSNLSMDSVFVIKRSRRLFVPVYATSYEYRGVTYRVLVNGSTAKVTGQRPYSTSKLASISVTGIGAAIGIISSRLHNSS